MPDFKLQKEKIQSLKDIAYNSLKEAILSNNIKPGEKIIETDIADQLGISRGPIREAMRQLESDGLLHNSPYRGTIVAQRSEEEASLVYMPMRRTIESYACKRASSIFNDDDFDILYGYITELEEICPTRDYTAASRVDDNFHRYVVSKCCSDMLTSLWNSLSTQFYMRILFQNLTQTQQNLPSFDVIPAEHYDYINAIRSRDPDEVDRMIIRHIK